MSQSFSTYDPQFSKLIYWHQLIFGGWSLLNMALGMLFLFFASNTYWYWGLMTLSWALVNMFVLWWLYLHTREKRYTQKGQTGRLWVQHHIERMFVINVILDVVYLITGLYLMNIGNTSSSSFRELQLGFGCSIIIQGGFLCLQDGLFWWLYRRNYKENFFHD